MSGPPPPPGPPPELKSAEPIKPNEEELSGVNLRKVDEKEKSYKTLLDMFVNYEKMNQRTKTSKFIDPSKVSWKSWHGAMGNEEWPKPKCVAKTEEMARKDQGNETNASEYLDHPEVLDAKMEIVANLIKRSKKTVAYTGAGISRAAGIADYATKAKNSVMSKYQTLGSPTQARPTYSHYVLSYLERKNMLHYYVQQNHDGLPQKAGYPQTKMNEIHGGWFDPSNPVVSFKGKLRGDLFKEMHDIESQTEFCICMGTSLSGMNSDRMVWTPCESYFQKMKGCFGAVIVNLQFTPIDGSLYEGYVPVRVWAKIDDAMKLLVKHLFGEGKDEELIKEGQEVVSRWKTVGDEIVCNYNEKGRYDPKKRMVLNLGPGQKVKVAHPMASNFGRTGRVIGKGGDGHSIIEFGRMKRRLYGGWWNWYIKEGKVSWLPIMNANPRFLKEGEEYQCSGTNTQVEKKKKRKKYVWKK